MNTTESNKLIAEFMGFKLRPDIAEDWYIHTNRPAHAMRLRDAKYHASWDWLMPVVEKIERMECDVLVMYGLPSKYQADISDVSKKYRTKTYYSPSRIEATYRAVVEFIQWYNENQ